MYTVHQILVKFYTIYEQPTLAGCHTNVIWVDIPSYIVYCIPITEPNPKPNTETDNRFWTTAPAFAISSWGNIYLMIWWQQGTVVLIADLRPNSIRLSGSKLVADLLAHASSLLASWMIGKISARCRSATSFEPDSVMEFGFYRTTVPDVSK